MRLFIIPHNHVTICTQQHGSERVMGIPQLHVSAISGIANIEWIENQQAAIVTINNVLSQSPPAILSHGNQVRQGQPGFRPFWKRQLGGPYFNAVVVVRRTICQKFTLSRVNFALLAIVVVGYGAAHTHSSNLGLPDCSLSPLCLAVFYTRLLSNLRHTSINCIIPMKV